MRVTGTEQQMLTMAANAVNASRPMGLGNFQFDPAKKYEPKDFKLLGASGLNLELDYIGGRMVKVVVRGVFEGERAVWTLPDYNPRPDYQSWCREYPTWSKLAESAGLEVIP